MLLFKWERTKEELKPFLETWIQYGMRSFICKCIIWNITSIYMFGNKFKTGMQNIETIIISYLILSKQKLWKVKLMLWSHSILILYLWKQVNKRNISNKRWHGWGDCTGEKRLKCVLSLGLTQQNLQFPGLIQQYPDIQRFRTKDRRKVLGITWPITPTPWWSGWW